MDRTLIIVKPHAVARGLVGTFLERFERMGFQITAIKVVREGGDFWERFYPSDQTWLSNAGGKTLETCQQQGIDVQKQLGTTDAAAIGRMVKKWLVDHMSSGPAVAAVLQGNEAPAKVRLACGSTLPNKAAPGTIRFDFSADSPILANVEARPVYNLIHASDQSDVRDGQNGVAYELALMFPDLSK